MQAKGILTYRNGRIVYVDKLAQAARDATQDMWDLLDIVTKEPRADTGRVPKIDDIYSWQEYASKLKAAIAKAGRHVTNVSENGGIQVAAISPGHLEETEDEWGEYVKLRPKLPRYSEIDQELTAAGQVGVCRSMGVRDLTSIVNTLPLMKSNSTNSEFWDRLWVMARANRLAVKDKRSVFNLGASLPVYIHGTDHLTPPLQPPANADDYATQYRVLRTEVQHAVGNGIQTFTNVTMIRQGPNEPFVDYTERFTKALKEFVAARRGPDLDSPIMLHTAQLNMNAKFTQLFHSSLSTIID